MLFDLFYKLSSLTDSYAQLLTFGHHWKWARLPMTTLWFSGANPIAKLFLSWQLKQMLQITSYVIAERKSPNWPFLLLILLPKTTLILWYKSYQQTFPELIIVDVTPYFICNCWTQVTKLVTSTAYFVAKNFFLLTIAHKMVKKRLSNWHL